MIRCTVPGPQESAELLGVNDYLIKPVARARLLAAIERAAPAAAPVLLVDDDPDALLLFRRMLASTGRDWRVIRAENGQQALQVLAEQRPDLVLLDLIMPGMGLPSWPKRPPTRPWPKYPCSSSPPRTRKASPLSAARWR